MKISLRMKSGSVRTVESGQIVVSGSCVALFDITNTATMPRLVIAYCMAPGETVREEGMGEYIVEF